MKDLVIIVTCSNGGQYCRASNGSLTFTRLSGQLYQGSDGKQYQGGASSGFAVMYPVIDARPPSPSPPSLPGQTSPIPASGSGSDTYGSGGLHDWYLIVLALITLFVVMKTFPKWGMPLGWLVLAGAVLSTEPAVQGFQGLVRTIQTGSIQ